MMENKEHEYKYGFKDKDVSVVKTKKGLTEETIREISSLKNEPEWMLEFRLKALETFLNTPNPSYGPDLSSLDFDSYTYFTRPTEKEEKSWDQVPETIKNTFARLGIPEAEAKYLSGVSTQYESEVVYHNMLEEVDAFVEACKKGSDFLDAFFA